MKNWSVDWKDRPKYLGGLTGEMVESNNIEMGESVSEEQLDQLIYPFTEINLTASKLFRVDMFFQEKIQKQ